MTTQWMTDGLMSAINAYWSLRQSSKIHYNTVQKLITRHM